MSHLEFLNKLLDDLKKIHDEIPVPLPEQDFFAKYGSDQISLNGWLGEPKFSVEEFAAAIEKRIRGTK